jgi:hypothetical protein
MSAESDPNLVGQTTFCTKAWSRKPQVQLRKGQAHLR